MPHDLVRRYILVIAHEQHVLRFVRIGVVGALDVVVDIGLGRSHVRHLGQVGLVAHSVLPLRQGEHFVIESVGSDHQIVGLPGGRRQVG